MKHKEEAFYGYDHDLRRAYSRDWGTQPRPYKQPCALNFSEVTRLGWWDLDPNATPPDAAWSGLLPTNFAKSQAYGKLLDSLDSVTSTSRSGWGENLAQAKDAIGMVSERSLQLLKFTRAISSGRFGDAGKALGLRGIPRGIRRRWKQLPDGTWRKRSRPLDKSGIDVRRHSSDLGSAWLEYHFGWQPLVQDIGDSLNTMSKANFDPKSRIQGQAHASGQGFTRNYDDWQLRSWDKWQADATEKMSAKVSVKNPNAFLAQRFGVVNPATLAWNLIPFSFVVDWFANVSQVLDSMTDFMGVEVESPSGTSFQRHTREKYNMFKIRLGTPPLYHGNGSTHQTVFCSRSTSLTPPPLTFNKVSGLGLTRGATAVSLLTQALQSLR